MPGLIYAVKNLRSKLDYWGPSPPPAGFVESAGRGLARRRVVVMIVLSCEPLYDLDARLSQYRIWTTRAGRLSVSILGRRAALRLIPRLLRRHGVELPPAGLWHNLPVVLDAVRNP